MSLPPLKVVRSKPTAGYSQRRSFGGNVGGGVVEGVEAVSLGDRDGLGAADLSVAGEDVGEVDGYRLGVDGGDHLFAGDDFDELGAGLADLVVEGVAMALLDDDLDSWECW